MKAVCNIGDKYWKMTVLEFAGKAKNGATLVRCKCDCGNERTVRLYNLISSAVKPLSSDMGI